jgi:hypothetical protein
MKRRWKDIDMRSHNLKHIHRSITSDRVTKAVMRHSASLDNPGFCLAWGADAEDVGRDSRECACDVCDQPCVYGAGEVLIMGAYHKFSGAMQ